MNAAPSSATAPRPSLTEAEVSARLRDGAPDHLIDVGHSKIPCWSFGQGPALLCVHGWPLHAATFRRIVPLLAGRYTVHLIDLPGTGRSSWSASSRIDLASHAASVRSVIDALGLDRYALLAHDSGAAIARLAAADDRRMWAMVMGNTEIPGHHPWQIGVFMMLARIPGAWQAFLASMRSRTLRRSPLGFGGCFADPAHVDGDFGDLFVRPLLTSSRVAAGQSVLVRNLDVTIVDRLDEVHGRLKAPVLCVWGPKDPFFPIAGARRMLGQFAGGAELVEIPGAGLFAHEDHPERFASLAGAFLDKHAPREV